MRSQRIPGNQRTGRCPAGVNKKSYPFPGCDISGELSPAQHFSGMHHIAETGVEGPVMRTIQELHEEHMKGRAGFKNPLWIPFRKGTGIGGKKV